MIFCHKCGTKAIDDADFCQKCGARLIKSDAAQASDISAKSETVMQKESEPLVNPVSVTKVNECAIEEKPATKKTKNIPLLIVVLAVLVLILACIIAAGIGSSSLDSESSYAKTAADKIELTKSFSEMGISFNYPESWTILDDGSEYIIISMYDSNNNADHRITFEVGITLYDDPMNVFSGDEALVRQAVNENMSFLEYKETSLGDISAKYLKYQMDGLKSPDISENYYYKLGNDVYQINCKYTASDENIYSPLFKKIIDGYAADSSSALEANSDRGDDLIRKAYIKKISELAAADSSMTFKLHNIIPGDVYTFVAEKPGYYINMYTYYDGNVIPIIEELGYGAGGTQAYEYLPGKNIIRSISSDRGGQDMYTTYLCIDSNHSLQHVYDSDLCYSFPSSYYYGTNEIDEYFYNYYLIEGNYSFLAGTMTADEMIKKLSEGEEIKSSNSDEIIIYDTPVSSLIGVPVSTILYLWGEPLQYLEGAGVNYCIYDGIEFEFNGQRKTYVANIDPKMCSFNGQTLDKNRDGLLEIMGTPTSEGWGEDYNYYLTYENLSGGRRATFIMSSPDENSNLLLLS